MASSSGARWRVACDRCEASAWTGPASDGHDVWCEACQVAHHLAAAPGAGTRCPRCDAPLPAAPRFIEVWGALQHLDAVLAAWAGDPAPLARLLPERPRFVTDLDPPQARPDDPAPLADAIAACAHGDFRAVPAPGPGDDPRAHAAYAIACERLGDPARAVLAWDAVLAAGDDARARLARGSLHARAGRLDAARADLALAGPAFPARGDRAALAVHAAVAGAEAAPDPGPLAAARAEAGEASSYWSDPTVGRLLWSLLVERAVARVVEGGPDPRDREALRAAESEFEHATFWDRAMRIVGWVRVGALDEAARIAAPLARDGAAELLDEPALRGPALASVAAAVTIARAGMDAGDPVSARHALAEALARQDLQRFRIPCLRCGRGSVGLDETADGPDPED
ncbi:MAG: hypothetical protein ACKO3S_02415 [bacterium]